MNRGPNSLGVLRFVKSLEDHAIVVLGNHDLHLLIVAVSFVKPHRGDTLSEILEGTDREALLSWLRHRPLLHQHMGVTMVHAGLLPNWTIDQARCKRVARPRSLTALKSVEIRYAAARANRFRCLDRSVVFPAYRAATRQDPSH